MAERSARLGLPMLAAGQAQKEWTHNEALALLDMVAAGGVESMGLDAPPPAPAEGRAWIVGSAPTRAWAGRARHVAGWTGGGWRFVPPAEGMGLWVADVRMPARFEAGAWVPGELRAARVLVGGVPVLGAREPAMAAPAGGATVDAEARAALGAVLAAMRAHGLIET